MKTTKHLILGALSCLLLAAGFANLNRNSGDAFVLSGSTISPGTLAYLPGVPSPGDGTKPLSLAQPA
jgi:hypothetical protein